jgi:stalled ribosome rescue protein Dom34
MTARVGLWIDHRKAVIVSVSDEKDVTTLIESHVDKHVRYSGGARSGASHGSQEGTGEDTRERHFEGQLGKYYDEVIAQVRDAEAIVILGPGEAKGELKTRLEHAGLGARIVGVETFDKLTDRQIAAIVRERLAR